MYINQNENIFNTKKLQYNTLIMNGYNSFQNKQISKALSFYQSAQKLNPESTNGPLIKSIIGVLHMHNCNYQQAMSSFQNGIKQIQILKAKKSNFGVNNQEIISIYIKLYANLSICYLVTGEYQQSIEKVQQCLNAIRQQPQQAKKDLFESLVYIFFRFTSFYTMKSADFQSVQTKYDESTQACFYSTIAINKQLCSNPAEAYKLQKKVLQIWTSKNQYGFMLIAVKNLVYLAKQLNMNKTIINDYENQIKKLMQSDKLSGISEKTLFKGYQQKMKCAKQITNMLYKFQNQEISQINNQQRELKGWKEAIKLKLLKSINYSKSLQVTAEGHNKSELKIAIQHMEQTLTCLQNEKNVLIIKNLQKSKFVIEALNNLKAQLNRIKKFYLKSQTNAMIETIKKWRLIKNEMKNLEEKSLKSNRKISNFKTLQRSKITQKPENQKNISKIKQPQQVSQFHSNFISTKNNMNTNQNIISSKKTQIIPKILKVDQISMPKTPHQKSQNQSQLKTDKTQKHILRCIKICQIGQYFLKRNFSSDGGQQKFIRLTKSEIQWATQQKKFQKSGKYQSYQLKQVKGILYGKISDTFKKSCNKNLQNWRCFSLVLQKRTFDLYSDNDNDVTDWIVGISAAVQKANPQKQNLLLYKPGRVLWRKMFLLLYHHFYQPLKKSDRSYYWTLAQAIVRFKQNGYKLPQKKKK